MMVDWDDIYRFVAFVVDREILRQNRIFLRIAYHVTVRPNQIRCEQTTEQTCSLSSAFLLHVDILGSDCQFAIDIVKGNFVMFAK